MHWAGRKSTATGFWLGLCGLRYGVQEEALTTALGPSEHQWGMASVAATMVLPIPSNRVNEVLMLEEPEPREFSNSVLGCLVMAQ